MKLKLPLEVWLTSIIMTIVPIFLGYVLVEKIKGFMFYFYFIIIYMGFFKINIEQVIKEMYGEEK